MNRPATPVAFFCRWEGRHAAWKRQRPSWAIALQARRWSCRGIGAGADRLGFGGELLRLGSARNFVQRLR